MILSVFKSTGIKGLLFNLFIILLFWCASFLKEPAQPLSREAGPMPLYGILLSLAEGNGVSVIVAFGIFLLLSFLIVNLNTSLFFIQERTYLPSSIYVMFCSSFTEVHSLNPVIPAAVFLLLALKRIMDAYRQKGTAFSFFDASLLIGTGILFYAGLIWFGLILIAGVITLRGYNFREILLSLAGLAVPFIMLAGVLYVAGSNPGALPGLLFDNLFDSRQMPDFSNFRFATGVISTLILLAAIIYLAPRINNMKIRSGKLFALLLWILVFSAVTVLFSPGSFPEVIYLAGIPAGYIITWHILNNKKLALNRVIIFILFAAAGVSQAMGLL